MQNAPAPLAQRMMSRQAPYGPVGMVSQNMSGNKKGAGGGSTPTGVIGLKFNTATATSGLTFSNSDTTSTNTTGGNIASAKASAGIIPNTTNYWYWEFTVGTANSMFMGLGLPTFVCDAANRVGIVANSVAYRPDNGILQAAGATLTTVSAARVGDVIGFKFEVFNPGALLTVLKNGVVLINQIDISAYVADNSVAWTPIWSANITTAAATISNNIYEYAGFIPVGTVATTVAASASVPAVADGKYDVYTFNASGTFTASSTGSVRALVIAGGAAGATGGGGAGGYQEKGIVATPQTYTITVGAGGPTNNTNGSDSSIGSVLVSTGGGTGNTTGGSGGGGYPAGGFPVGAYSASGAAGIAGQGFAGGGTSGTALAFDGRAAGGGGGAGGVGGAGSGNGAATGTGGAGGSGASSNITGTAVTRAGGAGGYGDAVAGAAGSGGGGIGGLYGTPGGTGAVNTGSGGGASAAGGSGVVIIRVRARA